MKRKTKLRFAFCIFLGFLILPSTVLGAFQDSRRELHAAPGKPNIDGDVDDVWNSAPAALCDRIVANGLQIPPEEVAVASFRCLWDASNVYVLAEVKDSNLRATNGAEWEQDSVEVFVDENLGRTDGYESNDGQFRIGFRGNVSYGQSTNARINAAAKVTATGYRVEVAIPLRSIKAEPGTRIGLEFQVNNDAGKGVRSSISKWNEPTNDSWHDTSGFGTLVLSSLDKIQKYNGKPSTHGHHEGGLIHQVDAATRVPNWAQDAVFYQVFPERFRNGDPSNDPTHASLEFPEIIPQSWEVTPWTSEWYARADWEKEIGDNFYEDGVFHRRYGGDLQGVIDKLEYLSELGINTIYFNPVFYARSLHKYDGNSYHHIDPHFGPDPAGDFKLMESETDDPKTWNWTSADKLFLSLVKQAHEKNIRVVIDGVFNHTGRDFWAFADVAKNQQNSPYLDWYIVETFDDPSTKENEFKYACWWGVDTLPEFANNEDGTDLHPKPKAYIFNATRRWMDPNNDGNPADGIDGWRLDVANEVPNQFWRDWTNHVREINKDAFTIAEVWENAGDYLSNCGFSSTMNYHGFAYPVKGFLIDGNLTATQFGQQVVERMENHPEPVRYALQNLIDGHDTDRVASMIVNSDHKWPYKNVDRFDYDVGERVSPRHFKQYDVTPPTKRHKQLQKLVAFFQMTFVGPPMIYYGTEAGMDGADDPCDRMPMVWEDLQYDSRAQGPYGKLKKTSEVTFDKDMFGFYQIMIQARKKFDPLRRGSFSIVSADDKRKTILFKRIYRDQTLYVALNRGAKPVQFDLSEAKGELNGELEIAVHTAGKPKRIEGDVFEVDAESGVIWVEEKSGDD